MKSGGHVYTNDEGESWTYHSKCFKLVFPPAKPEPLIPCHICEPTTEIPRSLFPAHVRAHALADGEYTT